MSVNQGHGTHVAGIIGATQNNGIGISGINPYARLMAIKILPSTKGAWMSDLLESIDYAVKMGATVANHSWGWTGPKNSSKALEQAFKRAVKSGMFMATANGNDINNNDYQGKWPAAIKLPGKITAASTDAQDQLSGFSNYGLNVAGIAAPGSYIFSTLPRGSVDGPYGYLDGTSMASPMVAGVASLIKSAYPKLKPSQIASRILKGVDQINTLTNVVTTGGRLNAFKSLHSSAKDKLNEFTLLPQWKYGSQMRESGGTYTGYGDQIWAQAGNQNNYDCMPMLFFDLPRLKKPIRSADFQIQVTNFWTPATQELLEIRVNPGITPAEAIEYAQSYENGASTHQELLKGDLLATAVLDKATYNGDQSTRLTIPIDAEGIELLNDWAGEPNGRNMVLTVGIGGSRPVDPLTGELLYGGISFSRSDMDLPSLNLDFRKSAKARPSDQPDDIDNSDTTAPVALVLALAADTGNSSTDRITTNGNIRVTGIEEGATWKYSTDAGRTWLTGFGSSFSLGEGNYFPGDILARQIDTAGNISPLSDLFPKLTVISYDQDVWVPVAS
ncbi:S8 family serine peptidase [Vulcanococcus sp. Clear-D1]|uniref:S8 family serine peptidase n=1 Tax=Vulcanococcus sp. Clear-D1 TaxID=2766970 RepID=UPI0019C710DD|nr:S8 family serine peptidase [Vulcanococcus sp. Clear-D1]MBD1194958.1 S8 family serine peptidase [Vulcanococcus sp. Clear-D1]